jgi:hypothetical protein
MYNILNTIYIFNPDTLAKITTFSPTYSTNGVYTLDRKVFHELRASAQKECLRTKGN